MSAPVTLESLRAQLDPALPVLLLIDPLLGEPLPYEWRDGNADSPAGLAVQADRELAWRRHVEPIALDARVELAPAFHPYLVELHGHGDPWLAQSIEIANAEWLSAQADGLAGDGTAAHRIGGWLQSALLPAALAASLAPLLRVNTQGFTQARYLRLADRRVLDWARQVVGDARMGAVLGRIERWCYADAFGRLAVLRAGNSAAAPLLFDKTEWARLMRGDAHHTALARWLGELAQDEHAAAAVRDAQSAALWQRVTAAVESSARGAKQWPARLKTPADHAAWAALNLLRSGFENHPGVRALLDAQAQPNAPIETLHTLCGALRAQLTIEGTPA